MCVWVCMRGGSCWPCLWFYKKKNNIEWQGLAVPHCPLWVTGWTTALNQVPLCKLSINQQCAWLLHNKHAEMMHGISAGTPTCQGDASSTQQSSFTRDPHNCTSPKEVEKNREPVILFTLKSLSKGTSVHTQRRTHTHTHICIEILLLSSSGPIPSVKWG